MSAFQVRALAEGDVPEVAEFLARSVDELRRSDGLGPRAASQSPSERAERLRERVFANPFARQSMPRGWVLLDEAERVAGAFLAYPWEFRLGERTLTALSGGPFFVDPAAAMRGLLLFRQFLAASGIDFWYSTTCNARAGGLWSKSGGMAVSGSDVEYLVVFSAAPLFEESILRRRSSVAAARAARLAGAIAKPLTWRSRSRLRVVPMDDWGAMAAVAERQRDRALLTCNRSEEYLRWTYAGRSRHEETEAFRFTAAGGAEGWFTLKRGVRGRANQIRSLQLLDVVWPREEMGFEDILPAITDVARRDADVLSIRPRPGISLDPRRLAVVRRVLPAPEAFVLSRSPSAAELCAITDIAAADAM
jgi:hypothetical protein